MQPVLPWEIVIGYILFNFKLNISPISAQSHPIIVWARHLECLQFIRQQHYSFPSVPTVCVSAVAQNYMYKYLQKLDAHLNHLKHRNCSYMARDAWIHWIISKFIIESCCNQQILDFSHLFLVMGKPTHWEPLVAITTMNCLVIYTRYMILIECM